MDNLIPIDKRAKQFAISIVKLYQYLVDERHEKVMSGLKVRMKKEEGIRALALCGLLPVSFLLLPSPLEASETHYWLELLSETGYLPSGDATTTLLADCDALISILVACVKTAKQKGEA